MPKFLEEACESVKDILKKSKLDKEESSNLIRFVSGLLSNSFRANFDVKHCRHIINEAGELLGEEAYKTPEGIITEDVIDNNIPKLVKKLTSKKCNCYSGREYADNEIIYLACPYADMEECVRFERWRMVNRATAFLFARGHVVYSPITHNHAVVNQQSCNLGDIISLKTSWEFWKKVDLTMMARCSKLYILDMEGWRGSVGVNAEIEYAKSNKIPIKILTPLQGRYVISEYAEHNEIKDMSEEL